MGPSDERVGSRSPIIPCSGEVSLRFSPDSTESKNKLRGSLSEFLSATTSNLLSGVHVRLLPSAISPTLRSGGPSGDTRYTESLPTVLSRRNAMDRPSGDQAGLESACGAVVKRNWVPDPMSLT